MGRRTWYANTTQVCMMMLLVVLVMVQVKLARSDINKDRAECAGPLAGLATCLPYVGGRSKAPTPDCCTGLQQVVRDSMKCLCLLIKDRNDPKLGLKINTTLALTLPRTCQAPTNVSECPAMLHLPPNDPDVKVFNDFAKAAAAPTNATTTTAAATAPATTDSGSGGGGSGKLPSDGGQGSKGMLYGVLLCCFVVFYHVTF